MLLKDNIPHASAILGEEVVCLSDKPLDERIPHLVVPDVPTSVVFEQLLVIPPTYPLILRYDDVELLKHLKNVLELNKVEYIEVAKGMSYPKEKEKVLNCVRTQQVFDRLRISSDVADVIKQAGEKKVPISTGFAALDEVLGGGLDGGRLYVVGAIPSLGKTTFALNLAANVAAAGRDVIIISLEMSRKELIKKLIIQTAFRAGADEGQIPTFSMVEKGLEGHYKEVFEEAGEIFVNGVGRTISVVGGYEKTDIKGIADTARTFTDRGLKPLVVIDYLQIMPTSEKYGTEKQWIDRKLRGLKALAVDLDIPIWAVSSLNRMAYLSEVNYESFKESGGIEMWADVMIGMHLNVEERKSEQWGRMSLEQKYLVLRHAKMASPRLVELMILKHRAYSFGEGVSFDYYPQFETFKENAEPL